MSMVDHLLTFSSEAAAHTALDPLGYGSSGTTWDTSRCNPNIQIITAEAVWNTTVFPPVLVTPQVVMLGWWIMISLPSLNATLQALSAAAAAFNRDTALNIWESTNVLQDVALISTRIAPVFAGSIYNFGV